MPVWVTHTSPAWHNSRYESIQFWNVSDNFSRILTTNRQIDYWYNIFIFTFNIEYLEITPSTKVCLKQLLFSKHQKWYSSHALSMTKKNNFQQKSFVLFPDPKTSLMHLCVIMQHTTVIYLKWSFAHLTFYQKAL